MPRFLGQHFLKNQEAIHKIVAAADIRSGDLVIEIGPGGGAITAPLAARCQEHGATLFAIEKDTRLVIDIQHKIPQLAGKVEHGDALEVLPGLVLRVTPQAQPYTLVGNIPYYITGSLLRTIGELEQKPRRTVLMIQKEVAERVSAKAPHMNLLAAATGFWGESSILFTLKPKDFDPPPEVSSAVIAITPKKTPAIKAEDYYAFIKAAFKQPRKNLLNNLTDGFPDLTRADIVDFMTQNDLPQSLRAQELDINRLVQLADSISRLKSA